MEDINATQPLINDENDSRSSKGGGKYPYPNVCPSLPFDIFPILVLMCICFLTFGSYWVYDIPGAIFTQLQAEFQNNGKQYSITQNEALYSVYQYPNVILALFGGILVDKLGVRFGAITFCTLIFIGQVLFSFGVQFTNYPLMVTGRFVFGLGGESLTVAQNTFTARWFEGKVLAFCFGIVVAFSRVGSAVNFAVTPTLTTSWTVPSAVWFGTGMCGISMVACIIGCTLDKIGENRVKNVSADEGFSIRDILAFKLPVWIIFLICITFYIAVLTFYTVASDIFQNLGYVYSTNTGSFFIFLPNLVGIFACPFFGYLVDKVGRSAMWMMLASSMLVVAHIAFLLNAIALNPLNQINPVPIMIWLGFSYSLGASALWPMIAFIVDPKKLGTAYGLMTSLQNAGLAISTSVLGPIMEADISTSLQYTIPIIIFVASAATAVLLSFLLIGFDKRFTSGKLNATALVRGRILRQEEQARLLEESESIPEKGDKHEKDSFSYE